MRRRIGQPVLEVEGQARELKHKMDEYQAKLRESEDKRQAMEICFAERLRLSSAELESSRAQVEALKLGSSRATSLSTALQEHVYELEAQVTARRSMRSCSSVTIINANSSFDAPQEASRRPHAHGQADPSTARGVFRLQCSDIAKDQRHAPQESTEWMCQRGSKNTHYETATKPDDYNLRKDLAATMEHCKALSKAVVI